MPTPSSSATDTLGASTIARLNIKLIPFLMLLYLVACIDRANISVAALQMNADLGLTTRLHLGAPLLAAGALLIAAVYSGNQMASCVLLVATIALSWAARSDDIPGR